MQNDQPLRFFIGRAIRFIDENGKIRTNRPLPDFMFDAKEMLTMYRLMVLTRIFDAKAIALQRTGQLGTYASCLGQEAVGVGIGFAMEPTDILVPSYRELGALLFREGEVSGMTKVLLYWGGDERGNDFEVARADFPICVPIATHTLHAVGAAYAMRYRSAGHAVLCSFGDGATSKGDFYEAINFAGVFKLPVVFVASNNRWAISCPREKQTGAETIAQKAIAAGIEGVMVDGNDVAAMRFVVDKALKKARAGLGPTLIEALTYRLGDHTTADDASRYRSRDELDEAWKREPILRLREALLSAPHNIWTREKDEVLEAKCAQLVNEAVGRYESMRVNSPQLPEAMFDHLFAELPVALSAERARVIRHAEGGTK